MSHQAHAIPKSGANSAQLSIGELSQLIAMGRGLTGRTIDTDTLGLFGDTPAQPATLDEVIEAMRAEGYQVDAPYRHYPSRKKWHAEWHVRMASPAFEVTLSFLIPLDAA